MSFKNFFLNLFKYEPEENYDFSIIDDKSDKNDIQDEKIQDVKDIFTSLNVNLDYIKTKYNILINSDIILREFTLTARGKQYNSFILYIDGMVDSQILNEFILEPLMSRNKNNLFEGSQNKVISEAVTNNITVKKVKKFDLSNYLMNCLMPQNSIKETSEFSQIISGINSRKLCAFC